MLFAAIKARLKTKPGWYAKNADVDPRRHRGDDDGRPSPLRHGQGRQAAVAGDQRQRQRHQVEVRQSLRLPRVAGRRHPPRHRRDDGRQGRDGRGLRRRRQGLGRLACATPAAACWSPRSIRSARCRRRWKATRSRRWTTPRRAPTSSSPRPATSTSSPSTTCARCTTARSSATSATSTRRSRSRALRNLQVEQRQAAGRRDRIPRRQAHHPAVGRPPREPRQRDRPSRRS